MIEEWDGKVDVESERVMMVMLNLSAERRCLRVEAPTLPLAYVVRLAR